QNGGGAGTMADAANLSGAGGGAGAGAGISAGGAGMRLDGSPGPAAQGAASFHFNTPASGSGTCTPRNHWANAPFFATTGNMQQVSFTQKDPLAVDGVSGAVV